MSKLFFDKHVSLEKVEKYVNQITQSLEEKEEIWQILDEVVHHKVLHCILNELDAKHHEEFIIKLHSAPHDESLLDYLADKIQKDIGTFLRAEIESLEHEILKDLSRDTK